MPAAAAAAAAADALLPVPEGANRAAAAGVVS
jgi:hypothetical protein